jgi:ribosomal protein S18 acetylase RimI-like enzyme
MVNTQVEGIRIRDGSVLDIVRTSALLRQCLLASPEIYPVSVAEAYSQYLTPTVLRGFLDLGGHLLVAERQLQVVGFSCGVPDSANARFGTYYGAWVAVDPTARLQGIGSRLLAEIEGRAFAAGNHKFYVLVQTTNKPGIRFFTRVGYLTEGVLQRHWNGYDFYFMSRFAEQMNAVRS